MTSKALVPVEQRLILALDEDDREAAERLVETLGDAVRFYKVGLQLFLGAGGFELVEWLRSLGKRVFLDLKLYDVPRTVEAAVGRVSGRGVRFLTVHGDSAIVQAACRAAAEDPADLGILAVTVLTSLDTADLGELGFRGTLEELVVRRALRARQAGCEGVIASGREITPLREALGDDFLLVIPGIRDPASSGADDQKRTVRVEEAFKRGADYVVVGRPIRRATNPREAALRMQERIAASLA